VFVEDQQYFEKAYKKLSKNANGVDFVKFIGWKDIQDMLKESELTMNDVNQLWGQVNCYLLYPRCHFSATKRILIGYHEQFECIIKSERFHQVEQSDR
jgi:hypothetical protein